MNQLPRTALHPYQVEAVEYLCQSPDRQVIAIMGAGKTTIALHAIADLKASTALSGPVLVAAPLLIGETVWHAEALHWEATAGLRVERVIGTTKQRLDALARAADIYITNYDVLHWLHAIVVERDMHFSLMVADEASAMKTPSARRTRMALQLGLRADRRWALTGTPRSYQLLDVWGPANFVTKNGAFPPFLSWRGAHFYPSDIYGRIWKPKPGVEDAIITRLRDFTHVVDRAALATRPPVVEIHHHVALPPDAAATYDEMDQGTTADFAKLMAKGIAPPVDIAVVGKLMQVLSGAIYIGDEDDAGARRFKVLHERRLDVLADIHEGHEKPTLVFVTFRHEIARIIEKFPFARELHADLIDDWNAGRIEMLVAHPASAGHGVNLQYGSDTLVWFSLPWSAELFTQANARLVRQGQRDTVTVHIITSPGRIDELALAIVRQRLVDQDRFITGLEKEEKAA
jgi:hypothetical protein